MIRPRAADTLRSTSWKRHSCRQERVASALQHQRSLESVPTRERWRNPKADSVPGYRCESPDFCVGLLAPVRVGPLNSLCTNTYWDAANITSDWITVDWDPTTYDYYVYAYLPDGTYNASTYYTPFDNDLGTFRGPDGVTCSWATGDQQAAAVSPTTSVNGLGTLWSVESATTDNLVGTYNAGTTTNAAAWQVLVFNPTGSVWNTNKVTTATFHTGSRTGFTTFEALFNTAFFAEVAPNKLLVQANWRNTKTFVVMHATLRVIFSLGYTKDL